MFQGPRQIPREKLMEPIFALWTSLTKTQRAQLGVSVPSVYFEEKLGCSSKTPLERWAAEGRVLKLSYSHGGQQLNCTEAWAEFTGRMWYEEMVGTLVQSYLQSVQSR